MIEVLVTIVLITIGVLGMVALQGRTISYTQDAIQRNSAAMLADNLVELMRADLDNVLSGGLPKSSSSYYKAAGSDFPTAPSNCSSLATLNASQRLGCWAENTKAALPGAASLMKQQFHICRSATPSGPTNDDGCSSSGSTIEIRVAWAVKGGECPDAPNNEFCTYTVRVEL
ncbi:type IV pilus modification protein PilV [Pseudomonas dryadis]|uniref:Type IV pilus modification protein PilV n=2 Tax=Pseudomonadales TaxID=72274 RepID=A0ABY1Z5D5_9GAMM|nr:type IV pilus modification protein PilV [Pseudomonas dryadis]TBV04699.1 type IV pilus modification protein PilV [Pseudomonas dryadis]TBV17214.1 type IV pilus modification protein PilV [Pseudomonas sp. FRB 230]